MVQGNQGATRLLHSTQAGLLHQGELPARHGKGDKTAVVHNSFKLPDRFDELCCRFLVGYFLRNNPAPAEGGEVALSAASLPCRFCKEQVAVVVQERAFIEVPFKTPGQETKLVPFRVGLVILLDDEVLLVYYGVVG